MQEARTYLSLFVGQVPQAERLYAAIAVPALVDPALSVPAVVVVAAPRSARDPICGVLLQDTHRQIRQAICKLIVIPLRLEQLCQLVSRETTFCIAAIASGLRVRWYVDARTWRILRGWGISRS